MFVQLITAVFAIFARDSFALRDVKLSIPAAVEIGKQAVLLCTYDMEGDPLYAVKWYKNGREFFRYTPLDNPPFKQFPMPNIHVKESMSNKTQIILDSVSVASTGEFSCEVSADAPSFFTGDASGTLQVVEIPKEDPIIKGLKSRYDINDTIKAECISSKSNPAANLTWFVNDYPVDSVHIRRSKPHQASDGYFSARVGIRLQMVQQLFINGRLRIRCLASMYNIYQRSTEVSIEIDRPKHFLRTTTTMPILDWEGFGEESTGETIAVERYPQTNLVFNPSINKETETESNVGSSKYGIIIAFIMLLFLVCVLR